MLPCHDAFGVCFAFESGGAFSVVQRFTQVAQGNPCRNWYTNACTYICICMCVNKHYVAYQDVDIEHGVLASVMTFTRHQATTHRRLQRIFLFGATLSVTSTVI